MNYAGYVNYFYLFKRPEEINFVSLIPDPTMTRGTINPLPQGLTPANFNDHFVNLLGQSPQEITYNAVGFSQKDFPTAQTAVERGPANTEAQLQDLELIEAIPGSFQDEFVVHKAGPLSTMAPLGHVTMPGNTSFLSEGALGAPVVTNDIARSYLSAYTFNPLGLTMVSGRTNTLSEGAFPSGKVGPRGWSLPSYDYKQNFSLFAYSNGGTTHSMRVRPSADQFVEGKVPPLKSLGGPHSYRFSQRVEIETQEIDGVKVSTETNTDSEYWENLVETFFNDWSTTTFSKIFREDAVTSCGIPYDYQTTLYNKPSAKSQGVVTFQPTYEQIYNYYDPDYEPFMKMLVDESLINERELPTIYDFLYSDIQTAVRPFLKIPPMAMEEISLASLDTYLTHYSFYMDDVVGQPKKGSNASSWKTLHNAPLYEGVGLTAESTLAERMHVQLLKHADKYGDHKVVGGVDAYEHAQKTFHLTWMNEMRKGVYFAESDLNTFNQAIDKDEMFPCLIKLTVPSENPGPLAKLLKETKLFDNLNTYIASHTVPALEGAPEESNAVYSNYYGAIVNGESESNLNIAYELKLNNIKVYFRKPSLATETYNDNVLSAVDEPAAAPPPEPAPPLPVATGPSTLDYSDTNWYAELDKEWAKNLSANVPGGLKQMVDNIVLNTLTEAQNTAWPGARLMVAQQYALQTDGKIDPLVAPGYKKTNWYSNIGNSTGYVKAIYNQINDDINTRIENALKPLKSLQDIRKLIATNQGSQPDPYYGPAPTAADDAGDGVPFEPPTDGDPAPVNTPGIKEATAINDTAYNDVDLYIGDIGTAQPSNLWVYRNDAEDIAALPTPLGKLITKLKAVQYKNKLAALFQKNASKLLRGPEDIIRGAFAHQETLMYEIAKYGIGENDERHYIQSIFLPVSEQHSLSYYDTQIVPMKDYFYKIFAHKAIVGSRYRPHVKSNGRIDAKYIGPAEFETPYNTDPANQKVAVEYEIEPYLEIVRLPYYNTAAVNLLTDKLNYSRVEDSPPLPPQIDFVPFRNVDNRIMILLRNSIGEYEDYPIEMFPQTDAPIFEDVYLSQDRAPGTKMLFKSDDSQGTFEVYKLDKPPTSYLDYSERPNAFNEAEFLPSFGTLKTDSYMDFITPNRPMYYTARFRDLHGKISNPTEIFKVHMIHEEGTAPYLKVETVDLQEVQKKIFDKKFSPVKKMQKYLYIQPNYLQTEIYQGESDIEGATYMTYDPALGGVNSVFGKRFKFRITSKQTGKKIDINLNVKPPAEIINNE